MQKSSLSTSCVQRKRVFFGGSDAGQTLPRTLNGPWLGRIGNFKMCRGNARSPNTVSSLQICIKVAPHLIGLGANTVAFRCYFCDTSSRTAEATSTRKTLWRRIVCCLKGVFVMSGREKKTTLLQNSGFVQRPVEREQNTAENSFCIQNSTISKTLKKCRQKNSTCFWGSREKVFLDLFVIFRLRRPIPPVHITKKSETPRTYWN